MSQRDELIEKYAADLKDKIGQEPDMDLLTKVTVALGPSIYNKDASMVAGSDQKELDTVKNNFLIKKLGLEDSEELMTSINEVIDLYGRSNPNKHRAVIYYLLVRKYGKESVYA